MTDRLMDGWMDRKKVALTHHYNMGKVGYSVEWFRRREHEEMMD